MNADPAPTAPVRSPHHPSRPNHPLGPPGLRWWKVGLAGLVAALIGVAAAWVTIRHVPWGNHAVRSGAWTGSTLSGSVQADMITRAKVAVAGLLALGRDETMYFLATQDDQGQALRSSCRYRVQGLPPAARWWSITAYADDYFLFDAPEQRYSLNGTTAQLDAQGRFELITGATPPNGADAGVHWLATPGNRGLVLTLRLYNPSTELQAAPGSLPAPLISRVGDCT